MENGESMRGKKGDVGGRREEMSSCGNSTWISFNGKLKQIWMYARGTEFQPTSILVTHFGQIPALTTGDYFFA